MLVALIATASLSYLQFDSGDILLIAATIATVGALWTFVKYTSVGRLNIKTF
jgi:branched-subunit amino acid ABC-type transport system permease component